MDNLTHSLVGAVMGQAGLKAKTGLAMPALIIGANLPDVDAACFFWLEGTEHLGFRRGITHGPPALVILPLILAGLLWGFDRWQAKRGKRPKDRLPVHFGWLFALSFIGCLSHPALDWLNVYGIRLLEPFSSQWFYGDTLFIIDVWLWALLAVSVWWSLHKEKRGLNWKRPARVGIAAMLVYIGVNWAITNQFYSYHEQHLQPGAEMIVSPIPFQFWKREFIVGRDKKDWYAGVLDYPSHVPKDVFGASLGAVQCVWPSTDDLRPTNPQLDAFLFWSRAPFATRAEDGSIIFYDARFYDPRARDRFSVALPDVECQELHAH